MKQPLALAAIAALGMGFSISTALAQQELASGEPGVFGEFAQARR
jgi:hypothetical protein